MKKKILVISIILLIAVVVSLVLLVLPHYKEDKRVHEMITGKDRIKTEEEFLINPTLDLCIRILNYDVKRNVKYHNERIKMANKCINLGSDNHKFGFTIRLRLAEIYKNLGAKDKAYEQLEIAKKIDKDKQIEKYNWLETTNLQDIN
jgi:hypothetical protein